MSDSVIFLSGALAFAVLGSLLVWLVSVIRRPREPDYLDQLQALAPSRRPARDVSGVVPLDPPVHPDRPGPPPRGLSRRGPSRHEER